MIGFTARAARQFRDLRQHYEELGRPAALRALIHAVDDAGRRIEADPRAGLSAPRPYPELARPGWKWLKAGRYWIAYTQADPPEISAVFFETANIPGRL